MKFRPLIVRFAAFFLLVVFLQKTGGGLFIHNLFHTADASQLPSTEKQSISYNCNCIDDFLLPFIETEEPVIAFPHSVPVAETAFYKAPVPFSLIILSSLRGPPAHIL